MPTGSRAIVHALLELDAVLLVWLGSSHPGVDAVASTAHAVPMWEALWEALGFRGDVVGRAALGEGLEPDWGRLEHDPLEEPVVAPWGCPPPIRPF